MEKGLKKEERNQVEKGSNIFQINLCVCLSSQTTEAWNREQRENIHFGEEE